MTTLKKIEAFLENVPWTLVRLGNGKAAMIRLKGLECELRFALQSLAEVIATGDVSMEEVVAPARKLERYLSLAQQKLVTLSLRMQEKEDLANVV